MACTVACWNVESAPSVALRSPAPLPVSSSAAELSAKASWSGSAHSWRAVCEARTCKLLRRWPAAPRARTLNAERRFDLPGRHALEQRENAVEGSVRRSGGACELGERDDALRLLVSLWVRVWDVSTTARRVSGGSSR